MLTPNIFHFSFVCLPLHLSAHGAASNAAFGAFGNAWCADFVAASVVVTEYGGFKANEAFAFFGFHMFFGFDELVEGLGFFTDFESVQVK